MATVILGNNTIAGSTRSNSAIGGGVSVSMNQSDNDFLEIEAGKIYTLNSLCWYGETPNSENRTFEIAINDHDGTVDGEPDVILHSVNVLYALDTDPKTHMITVSPGTSFTIDDFPLGFATLTFKSWLSNFRPWRAGVVDSNNKTWITSASGGDVPITGPLTPSPTLTSDNNWVVWADFTVENAVTGINAITRNQTLKNIVTKLN